MLHFLNQAWIKSKLTIQPKTQTNKQEKKINGVSFLKH